MHKMERGSSLREFKRSLMFQDYFRDTNRTHRQNAESPAKWAAAMMQAADLAENATCFFFEVALKFSMKQFRNFASFVPAKK